MSFCTRNSRILPPHKRTALAHTLTKGKMHRHKAQRMSTAGIPWIAGKVLPSLVWKSCAISADALVDLQYRRILINRICKHTVQMCTNKIKQESMRDIKGVPYQESGNKSHP